MSRNVITVLVAADGRHLFDAVHDNRVRCVTSASDAPDIDLVVFPCGRHRRFENVASLTLDPLVLARIASGETRLVFDASLEGVPHKPDITAALHGVLAQMGAAPPQAVYLTQDRQYDSDYRAHCQATGLDPVTVLTHDYWIWDALGFFEHDAEQVYADRLNAFRARRPERRWTFLSLNRTPRPAKILFLLCLIRDGLWDRGAISFGGFRKKEAGPGKGRPTAEQLAAALPGFEDLAAGLAPSLDRLDAYGRVLLGMERHGWSRIELTQASQAVDLDEYHESWFSIVTETEMRPRPSRVTEKVIKPLVNFHPLMVFGNPDALKMIRSYGFVTFDELIDESYDDEWDPRRRFDRLYAEVQRLCRLDEREWRALEARISEKLAFNARWGLTHVPSVLRRERDAALVNAILGAVDARLHRSPHGAS